MNYEALLESAYEEVKPVEECGRFEILKVKGHHEGTKTIITNFLQVATCIRRASPHLIKFLNKELASSSELSGDRLILSRKLSSKEINEKIEKYVNLFVLCPKCKKPDTEIVEEKGKTMLRCMACGDKYEIHKV
jgi:translation initiation factor 2 subunit 2